MVRFHASNPKIEPNMFGPEPNRPIRFGLIRISILPEPIDSSINKKGKPLRSPSLYTHEILITASNHHTWPENPRQQSHYSNHRTNHCSNLCICHYSNLHSPHQYKPLLKPPFTTKPLGFIVRTSTILDHRQTTSTSLPLFETTPINGHHIFSMLLNHPPSPITASN